MNWTAFATSLVTVTLLTATAACFAGESQWRAMQVTATAYNSVPSQTDDNPALTAWGDVLKAGMKAIAVSRDLIAKGLDYGTRVKIESLEGVYVVRDKMSRRWKHKIDIYMGKNVNAARQWGVRKVLIWWQSGTD